MRRRNQIIVIGLIIAVSAVYRIITFNTAFDDAKDVVNQFYTDLIANNTDMTETFFHPTFFKITSVDEMKQLLNSVNSKLGIITEYENTNMKKRFYSGTDGSYTQVELVYKVTRTKYDSVETFTLLKLGSTYLIYGYNINSQGLFE